MSKRYLRKRQTKTNARPIVSPAEAATEVHALKTTGWARFLAGMLPGKAKSDEAWQAAAAPVLRDLDRAQGRGDPAEQPAELPQELPVQEPRRVPAPSPIAPALLAEQQRHEQRRAAEAEVAALKREGREVTRQLADLDAKEEAAAAVEASVWHPYGPPRKKRRRR